MDSAACSSSFSRSRTPSPRSSAAFLAAAFLLAACVPAPSLAAAGTGAPADTARHRAKPFTVMLRSTVVPGWGQVYNHKYLKAAAVVGVEGFLVAQALGELHRENQALDREAAVLNAGRDVTDPEYIQAKLDEETHRNRKINWIWWGIAAHLLSMVDAYVDAHLATFETDFGPPESAVDVGEKPRLTLAYRLRF